MTSIADLKRNDVPAALSLYQERLRAGSLNPSTVRSLLLLQDDKSELLREIERVNPESKRSVLVSPGPVPLVSGQPQSDADLTDDDLDALADLDTSHPPWDLPTEDDGGALDENADADLREDSWREDYNPNRASDGRFAPGPHHEQHGRGPARSWRLAFDATGHQRTMEAHRAAETVHRAKSLQIKERMASIRQQAQSATPKQRAALQRRYERLAAQHEEHRSAAGAAREARVQTAKDLEQARATHAEQRRSAVAQRSEAEWGRKRAEAESMLAIGQHRITGSEGHPAVTSTVHEPHVRQHVSEVESHIAAQRAEAERARRTTELEQRDLAQRLGVGKPLGIAVGAEQRQVVHYAQPKLTQQQMNERDAAKRARELASDERSRARNTERGLPHAAQIVSLPPAHVVTRAHKYLAGILGK